MKNNNRAGTPLAGLALGAMLLAGTVGYVSALSHIFELQDISIQEENALAVLADDGFDARVEEARADSAQQALARTAPAWLLNALPGYSSSRAREAWYSALDRTGDRIGFETMGNFNTPASSSGYVLFNPAQFNNGAGFVSAGTVGFVSSKTSGGSILSATGATIDWSSTAATTAWATATNWVGGTAPANSLTTNIARFDQTSYTSQPTSGTTSISGIQIGDGATATAALTVSSAGLSIGSDGITMSANSGTALFTGGTMKIGANQNWANNSSSLLTIASNVSNTGNTTPFTLTLNGSGVGGTTFGTSSSTGVISDGGATGTTAVNINTTGGVTTLNGNSTFTGGLTLTQGILRAQTSAGALGLGTLTLAGGELQTAVGNTNFGRNTTVTGDAQITSDRATTGAAFTATFGTLSIGGQTLTIAKGANVTSGTAGVTFGTTTLTGASTFSVGTGAQLTLGDISGSLTNTLTLGGVGILTLTGVNDNTQGLTSVTTGTLQLSKTAGKNAFAGDLTIGGGTVTLLASDQIANASSVSISSGTFGVTSFSDTIGNLSVTGGSVTGTSGVITVASGGSTSISNATTFSAGLVTGTSGLSLTTSTLTGALTLDGNLTVNAGGGASNLNGGVTINANQSWVNNNANVLGITKSSGVAITYNNLLTLNGGSYTFTLTGSASTTGAGGVKITNNSSFTNASTVNPFGTGTLELNSGTIKSSSSTTRTVTNPVSITGNFTFDSASTGINEFSGGASTTGDVTLTVNTVTTRFITNPFTLGGNLATLGNGRLNLTGGVNLGGADRTLTAGATGAGGNQISGAVDSSASGNKLVLAGNNFTMTGVTPGATNIVNFDVNATGTITFSGTNTFLGSVTVDAGTVNATSDSALGSSTAATAGLFMTPSSGTATVNFTSTAPAIASLSSSGAGTSNVVLGNTLANAGAGSATTLTVGGNNASTAFGGTISDGTGIAAGAIGNLTKTGGGTLILSGANTYTGTTIINAGTLSLDNNNNSTPRLAGTSSVTVNTGGTLLLAQSGEGPSIDRIRDAATMTLNGGTFNTGGLSEHGANNNDFGIGALTLQSSSIIDMANGASIIAFSNSLAQAANWSGTISVYNWSGTFLTGGGTDQLFFGNDATGLTLAQLADFQFYSGAGTGAFAPGAIILTDGEVVPTAIPETSTSVVGAFALLAVGYTQRRRIRGLSVRRA